MVIRSDNILKHCALFYIICEFSITLGVHDNYHSKVVLPPGLVDLPILAHTEWIKF